MNKVLVPGFVSNKDGKGCISCHYSFEWLLRYPSVFLWADKILMTQDTWKAVTEKNFIGDDEPLNNSIKHLLLLAKSENIIEIKDENEIITDSIINKLSNQVDKDVEQLCRFFPNNVKVNDDSFVVIDNDEICKLKLISIYAGLILAREWGAQTLFSTQVYDYCKYKFGINLLAEKGNPNIIDGFQTLYKPLMPNEQILPMYAIEKREKCGICAKYNNCKDGYLNDLEDNFRKIFKIRSYDEIYQIREVIDDIIDRKTFDYESLVVDDIVNEYKQKELKINKMVNRIFPKVRRWASLATMVSVPVAISGLVTGNSALAITGASIVGTSKIAEESIKYLTSKYNWVCFKNSEKSIK